MSYKADDNEGKTISLGLKDFWNEGVIYKTPEKHMFEMARRGWATKRVIRIRQLYIDLERKFYVHPTDLEYFNTKDSLVTNHLLEWCEENCEGMFTPNNGFWWEFQKKDDVVLFMLRWA